MSKSHEPQREREVQRYLQSWQVAQGSSLNVALNVESIALAELHSNGYQPHVSPDRALTAFAQLAVLRLGVKRGMVSLIDTSTQTVLAEANSTVCLGNLHPGDGASYNTSGAGTNTTAVNTDLWLGAAIVSRSDGLCENVLDSTYTATNPSGGEPYTAPALVVPNCRLDARFVGRPYVQDEPGIRFYAGVPIFSRNGHKIGAYAVIDETPRFGLTADELRFMQGVAQTITEHLEWARDRVDRFKGERIVRGLAAFIEGSSGVSNNSNDENNTGGDDESSPAAKTADESRRGSTSRPPQMTITTRRVSIAQASAAAISRSSAGAELEVPRRSRGQHHHTHHHSHDVTAPLPTSSTRRASRGSVSPARRKKTSHHSKPDSLSRMYGRAAEILRQSTLARGVMILGATASSAKEIRKAVKLESGQDSSDEEDMATSMMSGSEGVGMDSTNNNNGSDSDTAPGARPCKLLAYSVVDDRARADIENGRPLTLGTLEQYFAMFPRGKTFSFTDDGAGITSEDDSASDREAQTIMEERDGDEVGHEAFGPKGGRNHHRKVKIDHKEMLDRIPGAKSVVFVPLFDHVEDKLAGGLLLWTSVAGRMMNLDEDLSHLRAFGNSIMSQVARIRTQKNEAAKTTFIASMSHELRSPLHGILGAAEFLMDTTTDSYQAGLVTSISTCGKTLLDTLNHVLDYSKINKLGRLHMRRAAVAAANGKNGARHADLAEAGSLESLNMTAVVDLAVLIEEVVDAVAAGHTFKIHGSGIHSPSSSYHSNSIIGGFESRSPIARNGVRDAQQEHQEQQPRPVSVLLDIAAPRTSWLVRTQPGALRRIIMNLFGNALKYTSAGYIVVSLRSQDSSINGDGSSNNHSSGTARTDALIRVIDTGKGMSEDFQRDRLFVPFSQEDSFQPGTGLGLSIVKQIVDSLGGSIDVCSQQNRGTEVDVRLKLAQVPSDHGPGQQQQQQLQPEDTIAAAVDQMKGLKLVLLDGETRSVESSPAAMTPQVRKLNETVIDTCVNWFQMDVSREQRNQTNPYESSPQADLLMYQEPPSVEALKNRFRNSSNVSSQNLEIPVIIVCLNIEEAVRVSQNQMRVLAGLGKIVEVIALPCGPRKLARVFMHCLKRARELSKTGDLQTGPLLSPKLGDLPHGIHEASGDQPFYTAGPANAQPPTTNGTAKVHITKPSVDFLPTKEEPITKPIFTTPVYTLPISLAQPKSVTADVDDAGPPPVTSQKNDSVEEPKAEPKKVATKLTKPHVLLVDDNAINLRLLVMFMKKCGYTYEEAENGREALDKYMARASSSTVGEEDDQQESPPPFDFVLMDISMPVMNGIEATRRIREFERDKGLLGSRIIALTGLASADAQRDVESAGVDIFMPKPVRFAELKKLLTVA